jgi:hypothetical protein
LMIKITTWIEIDEIHVYNNFWFFHFKHAFGPKNYGFWKCVLIKSYWSLDGKKYWWLKYIVWEQNIVNKYLYPSHNCKLDIKNEKKWDNKLTHECPHVKRSLWNFQSWHPWFIIFCSHPNAMWTWQD